MSITKFIELMVSGVEAALSKKGFTDFKIEVVSKVKANDNSKGGICIKLPDDDISPLIYIDKLYEEFLEGESIDSLVKQVSELYYSALQTRFESDAGELDWSYDAIKDNLRLRIYDTKANQKFLSNLVHKDYSDVGLSVVPDIRIRDKYGSWCTAITKNLAEKYQYNEKTILAKAMLRSSSMDPPRLFRLSNFHDRYDENLLETAEFGPDEAYVLTSTSGYFGSYIMVFAGYMKRIASLMGPFYISPSSRHELILVPEGLGFTEERLRDILRRANAEVVEPDIVLSDDIFHFSFEHGLRRITE